MPLKIRVKPEGKFFVNGAVLKNVGIRPIDILIIDGEVMREEYLAQHIKDTKSPVRGEATPEAHEIP